MDAKPRLIRHNVGMLGRVDPDAVAFVRLALLCVPARLAALRAVARLNLPDGWIAAGMIRNAVWDLRQGHTDPTPANDVDVVWFDRRRASESEDRRLEEVLSAQSPAVAWSVRNQARMHLHNGHMPYSSTVDAMRHWPETATAVAARILPDKRIELRAPFGFSDLLDMVLRPGPDFDGAAGKVFLGRIKSRNWLARWPNLTVIHPAGLSGP